MIEKTTGDWNVLSDRMLNVTRDGRVQDWIERMADIARELGLPLEDMQWQGDAFSSLVLLCGILRFVLIRLMGDDFFEDLEAIIVRMEGKSKKCKNSPAHSPGFFFIDAVFFKSR